MLSCYHKYILNAQIVSCALLIKTLIQSVDVRVLFSERYSLNDATAVRLRPRQNKLMSHRKADNWFISVKLMPV